MQDNIVKTIIIGEGPSGLAIASRLTGDYLILEASDKVGRIYSHIDPHFKIVSPQTMCLLDDTEFDFTPGRVIVGEYANYLDKVALKFIKNIHFKQTVKKVDKKDNFFSIQTQSQTFICQNLIIASGKLNSLKEIS